MNASNKFNVFLCFAVLSLTAFTVDKPLFSDYVTGIQAVTSLSHENNNDDLDLCLVKTTKEISHDYWQYPNSPYNSNHSCLSHFTNLARAPPIA
jgi:hypothetical protein